MNENEQAQAQEPKDAEMERAEKYSAIIQEIKRLVASLERAKELEDVFVPDEETIKKLEGLVKELEEGR